MRRSSVQLTPLVGRLAVQFPDKAARRLLQVVIRLTLTLQVLVPVCAF